MTDDADQPEEIDFAEDDPLDENLAALAQAEAEMEAPQARRAAERVRQGHPAWGWGSLILAIGGLAWAVFSGTWAAFLKRPGFRSDRCQVVEAAILAAAILLGTIGRRRPAGRRLAFAGRLLALCTPPAAWLLAAAIRTYRGVADGDLVIASAVALVWLACGLFAFATFDALLEP